MKTALPALLSLGLGLATPAMAAPYPVDVESEMNGLDVTVRTSPGTPLVVTFASKETADVRCKASVESGLDTPQDRTIVAKAGKSTAITFTLRSTPNRVRVKASCAPMAKKPS